jgi:DNA processing protein
MATQLEIAQLVALLRATDRPWSHYSEAIERDGSAMPSLETEHGLLAAELAEAERATVEAWQGAGTLPLTVLDAEYPDNLRAVHDRPPLIFVAGIYEPEDGLSVAVVGSRDASPDGVEAARALSAHLTDAGYTVVSGLARGIDAAAHAEALRRQGRTVAVIGTGIGRVYPPEHADLQREIAENGAVVSQFWPDAPPSRGGFPMRNAVMSGMSLGTAIVEASESSGTRIQARRALLHGRPVVIRRQLLTQSWARALAERPGTYVYEAPADVTDAIARLTSSDPLTN